jgi:hypothetical protein
MWRKNEWPSIEGWYWFHGRTVCEARFGDGNKLGMVYVRQCANGVAVARNNCFIWESEMERPYWFMPIEPPTPPVDDDGNQVRDGLEAKL